MAASEESAIQKKLKPEEQEAQPAVTAIADRTEEEDKAEVFLRVVSPAAAAATSAHHAAVAGAGAGGVAEEMENGGGSGGAGGQQAAAAVAPAPGPEVVRSPLAAAVARLENHVLERVVKDPNAPYFPMPYPLLPPGTFEIIHDTEVDPHDDPENPIIWKEYTRIQGNLVLKRAGRKKGGVEIYDSVKEEGEGSSSGGPRRGRLVMETNAQAQAYYRSLRNNGAPAGGAAGAGRTDKGKETAEAGGSGIYQNAGAGVKTEHEDEHSEASNKGSGAILQPNKDGNQELTNDPENWGGLTIQESALEHHTDGNQELTNDPENWGGLTIEESALEHHAELTNDPENWGGLTTQENSLEHHSTALYSVMSNGSKIGDDNTNNEVGTETGTFPMLAGDDDNISALDRWFENKYLAEHSNDIPDILDESNADKVNTW
uniref:Uncharacterized protein n=1 Tax=Oryza brachyantha TaxID=4533 RepID=J3MJX8_ORYBR